MTSVVVADDQQLVRDGLRLILELSGIDILGEAADGEEAVRLVLDRRPDVVLMDLRMPRLDGLGATRAVLRECPGTRVVVVTTFNDDTLVREALRIGASGFVLKVAPPERLAEAVRVAAGGDALLDPLVTRGVIEALVSATEAPAPRLAVAAHVVRHLTADPLLPRDLLPADWPGAELRSAYADYQAELRSLAIV